MFPGGWSSKINKRKQVNIKAIENLTVFSIYEHLFLLNTLTTSLLPMASLESKM